MSGDYTLEEHRHRFAVWAAARATQRGFTDLGKLRRALECSGVRESLSAPETFQVSPEAFTHLHRQWCAAIRQHLIDRAIDRSKVATVTHGRAAKLVAVYLKAQVVMGPRWDTPLGRNLHPPIDRILLQTLASLPESSSPHKAKWRRTNWTQLDETRYFELIDQLRATVPADEPFWTVEKYWQPSDVDDVPAVPATEERP